MDMPGLFLKILNMSITAAYAALAVMLIRLALKKAPKAVSFALWLVVLFRLVCPVSFSSAFSLLRLGSVEPAARMGSSLTYIQSPAATHHVPPAVSNAAAAPTSAATGIAPAAPASAAPAADPIQTLLLIAAAVWAAGVLLMLATSVVSHIRLKRSISDATLLFGNVYETDAIRSPFVLGVIRPRIYLPACMDKADMDNVLLHERMHIKRKDNVIKPIAYAALCLHWFNLLVWIAFRLMCCDMEMSCDERVLRGMDEREKAGYGEALLKLSTSRRLLAGSPLAFGESPVNSRIKNVLKFKKPALWIAAIAVVAAVAAGVCLIANPSGAAFWEEKELYGNYKFDKQVYMCPFSSFLALDGYEQYYTLGKDTLTITEATGDQRIFPVTYERTEVNEQDFGASFIFADDVETASGKPDISQYRQRYQYTLLNPLESGYGYRLYVMDGEVWLAKLNYNEKLNGSNNEYIWSIYKMAKFGGELPQPSGTDTENGISMHISGTKDGVDGFVPAHGYDSGYEDDECYNITPQYIKENSDYTIFKYDKSCESFLLYQGEVYELGVGFGGYGVVSMTLADLNEDTEPELYFTSSWGSGVHRSQAGYFDPSQKQVVVFDYSNFNADMLVADNGKSGLSLYAAEITDMSSFVDLTAESAGYIADIVYSDGDIAMTEPQEEGQPQVQGSAPTVTSSAAPDIYSFEMQALPSDVEISMWIGGDSDRDISIKDETRLQLVKNVVADYQLNSAAWEGVERNTLDSYIELSGQFTAEGAEWEFFYIFDKDGKHYMQPGSKERYIVLDDETYRTLLDTALGYTSSNVMTVVSGDNSVCALENQLWSRVDSLHGEYPSLKPEQVEKYLQYLDIDTDSGELSPFTPYLDGGKVYGKYKLYDSDYNEIPVTEPSGLEPQTSIFANAQWPGEYIVELQATTEWGGIKFGNQYFFGVTLPEK